VRKIPHRFPRLPEGGVPSVNQSVATAATACVTYGICVVTEKNEQDEDENDPQNAIIIKVKATTTHNIYLQSFFEIYSLQL
jgi:hypothetical protein